MRGARFLYSSFAVTESGYRTIGTRLVPAPTWRNAIAPVVEGAAEKFFDTAPSNPSPGGMPGTRQRKQTATSDRSLPTRLTERKRSAGRNEVRKKPKRKAPTKRAPLPRVCVSCGEPVRRGHMCSQCHQAEKPVLMAKARDAMREQRAGGDVKLKAYGKTQERHQREVFEWNRTHEAPDTEHYKQQILPKLSSVRVIEIVRATGLSYPYCSHINNGRKIPHPRWWERLGDVGADT